MKKNMKFFAIPFIISAFAISVSTEYALAKEFKIAASKKLASKQMGLISVGITLQPSFLVDAWMTKEVANSVITTVNKLYAEAAKINAQKLFTTPQDEAAFIKKYSDAIAKGLNGFVDPIRDHKKVIVPIVEESLGKQENHVSLLTNFFKSPETNAKLFLDQEIKDVDSLALVCAEIVAFFGDLIESLSPGARQSYEDALNEKIKQLMAAAAAKKAKK